VTDDTTETIPIPGDRSVRGSLDRATDGRPNRPDGDPAGDRIVVACPPHPQFGGNRHDGRLTAVSERLTADGVACLRFDYGEWDHGYGECEDARNAVRWAIDRYDEVGIFGYSFGGAIAVLAAAGGPPVGACSSLAPASSLGEKRDAAAALEAVACPCLVVYGSRDDTADWEPLVERARTLGHRTIETSADHHFVGQREKVAAVVVEFVLDALEVGPSG
jgi:alpha/beta superfamily hydrolase